MQSGGRWRMAVLAGSLVLWIALSACSCGSLLTRSTGPSLDPTPDEELARGLQSTLAPTLTLVPTATLSPETPPTSKRQDPTAAPTVQRPASESSTLSETPNASDAPFVMEMTEAEIGEYLEQAFGQDELAVSDVQVVITEAEIIASGQAAYKPQGIQTGLTVRGIPIVFAGKLYLQIKDIALDTSLPALTRLLAKTAIEQAIKQYSTAHGIEVLIEGVEISSVTLQDGKMVIVGQTR